MTDIDTDAMGGGHAFGWDGLSENEMAMLIVMADDGSITINDQSIKNGIAHTRQLGRPFETWMTANRVLRGAQVTAPQMLHRLTAKGVQRYLGSGWTYKDADIRPGREEPYGWSYTKGEYYLVVPADDMADRAGRMHEAIRLLSYTTGLSQLDIYWGLLWCSLHPSPDNG